MSLTISVILILLFLGILLWENNKKHYSCIRADMTDYDVLKDYLQDYLTVFPKNMSKYKIDEIANMYVDYFCRIHIKYIVDRYPPDCMMHSCEFTKYDNFFKRNCCEQLIRTVTNKLEQVGRHQKLSELYNDTVSALGLDKEDPWIYDLMLYNLEKSDSYLIDSLCDRRTVLRYIKLMKRVRN